MPRARGQAARIADAEAYEAEVVNRAKGDAARFDRVFDAYLQNKDVTEEGFDETVEEIFSNVEKIIIDNEGEGGVVPYLPLKELNKAEEATRHGRLNFAFIAILFAALMAVYSSAFTVVKRSRPCAAVGRAQTDHSRARIGV